MAIDFLPTRSGKSDDKNNQSSDGGDYVEWSEPQKYEGANIDIGGQKIESKERIVVNEVKKEEPRKNDDEFEKFRASKKSIQKSRKEILKSIGDKKAINISKKSDANEKADSGKIKSESSGYIGRALSNLKNLLNNKEARKKTTISLTTSESQSGASDSAIVSQTKKIPAVTDGDSNNVDDKALKKKDDDEKKRMKQEMRQRKIAGKKELDQKKEYENKMRIEDRMRMKEEKRRIEDEKKKATHERKEAMDKLNTKKDNIFKRFFKMFNRKSKKSKDMKPVTEPIADDGGRSEEVSEVIRESHMIKNDNNVKKSEGIELVEPDFDNDIHKTVNEDRDNLGAYRVEKKEDKKPINSNGLLKKSPFQVIGSAKKSSNREWESSEVVGTNLIKDQLPVAYNWGANVMVLIISLIFGVVILFGGWLWLNNKKIALQEEILNLENDIVRVDDSIAVAKTESKKADAFKSKLKIVNYILDRHVYWTNFLGMLEENTLKNVYYKNLNVSFGDSISLPAVASEVTEIEAQTRQMLANPSVVSFGTTGSVLNIIGGEEKYLSFNVEMKLLPTLFYK